MIQRIRQWARLAGRDVYAVYRAARDPRVPWYAKALAFCVAGYALSPIDLIPDFIPVLGYLDDLIIVPLGIALAIRLVPPPLMAEFRARAITVPRPKGWIAAVLVLLLWFAAVWLLWRVVSG